MAPKSPSLALSPKSRIKKIIKIVSDGTVLPYNYFSIAKLLLTDGQIVLGIRYDVSGWSPNPDNGYPTVRGMAVGLYYQRISIKCFAHCQMKI